MSKDKHHKDFDKWSSQKQKLDRNGKHKKVRSGEVWWAQLGVNIGREQDGGRTFERPVIILRRINYFLALVVPLTSQVKNPESDFYYQLKDAKVSSVVLLPQIRTISTKRLRRDIERLSDMEFDNVLSRVVDFHKLQKSPAVLTDGGSRLGFHQHLHTLYKLSKKMQPIATIKKKYKNIQHNFPFTLTTTNQRGRTSQPAVSEVRPPDDSQ